MDYVTNAVQGVGQTAHHDLRSGDFRARQSPKKATLRVDMGSEVGDN